MKQFKLLALGLFFAACFGFGNVFCYWANLCLAAPNLAFGAQVKVGEFEKAFNCEHIFVIDNSFYNYYMQLENGKYVWKQFVRQSQDTINYLNSLTKNYAFIKTDKVYKITNTAFSIYYHAVPDITMFAYNWALEPVDLEFYTNWAYWQGRVVKTSEGELYRAKFYLTQGPLQRPDGWQKLSQGAIKGFESYNCTKILNFYKPIWQ